MFATIAQRLGMHRNSKSKPRAKAARPRLEALEGRALLTLSPIDLTADGGLGDTIVASLEDPFIRMDGISTFKIAIKRLSESAIFAVSGRYWVS